MADSPERISRNLRGWSPTLDHPATTGWKPARYGHHPRGVVSQGRRTSRQCEVLNHPSLWTRVVRPPAAKLQTTTHQDSFNRQPHMRDKIRASSRKVIVAVPFAAEDEPPAVLLCPKVCEPDRPSLDRTPRSGCWQMPES